MRRRHRVFRTGDRITSTIELAQLVLTGHYVMINDKPTHPSWLVSQPLHLLRIWVRGAARRAVVNEAYRLPPPRLFDLDQWHLVDGRWIAPNIEGYRP